MVSKKVAWITVAVAAIVVIIVTTVLLVVFLGNDSNAEEKVEETLVETTLGKINGSIFHTRLDKKFIGFRGIRYAEAPVDDLRFRVNIFALR